MHGIFALFVFVPIQFGAPDGWVNHVRKIQFTLLYLAIQTIFSLSVIM